MIEYNQINFLEKASIAVYVCDKKSYGRHSRKKDAFSVCGWSGLSMLVDVLHRSGYEIDRCNIDNVTDYKVILVSITSAIDWYSFVKERMLWRKGDYTVIVGGSGVDNIRPFLEFVNIFVWGRAENLIVPLIDATLQKQRLKHPSVCYADSFSIMKRYEIAQTECIYRQNLNLTNGKNWQEKSIGCKRKCLFCSYAWHRKHIGNTQIGYAIQRGNWNALSERTIFDLDLDAPATWPSAGYLILGIDGVSERLRYMLNKPITREMIYKLFKGTIKKYGSGHIYAVKAFVVIGYPTETLEDWQELKESIYRSDTLASTFNTAAAKITLHFTPFSPTPVTPAATWPCSFVNYRDILVSRLQHPTRQDYKWSLYIGENIHFNASFAIQSLPTTVLWMIAYRGIESDARLVKIIAQGKAYRGKVKDKLEWLENNTDIERFFRAYRWEELPTRYLHSYVPYETMIKLSDSRLRKYGGIEGQKLADHLISLQSIRDF